MLATSTPELHAKALIGRSGRFGRRPVNKWYGRVLSRFDLMLAALSANGGRSEEPS